VNCDSAILIRGARQNKLKSPSFELRPNQSVVATGISQLSIRERHMVRKLVFGPFASSPRLAAFLA
jgi:hypothetical protein